MMPATGPKALPGQQRDYVCYLGSESVVRPTGFSLGAYFFAATLEVVSRLHLHASLDSTSRVETVHPLVVVLLPPSITGGASWFIPVISCGVGLALPPGCLLAPSPP